MQILRTLAAVVAALLAAAFTSLGLAVEKQGQVETREVKIQPGEHWWAGVIAEAHRMPFTAESRYEFDFFADTAGNQGQPLLISNQGRYIWCDEPFRFEFDRGVIRLRADSRALHLGAQGSSAATAFQAASRSFFPASGRKPDPILFTRPQFNTWIELLNSQNQVDILKYARATVQEGYPPGVLMIDGGWAKNHGTWDFDRGRFSDPLAMMQELHQLGFKVMLWMCPYFTPDGSTFKALWLDQREKGLAPWIVNAQKPNQPVLMEWWGGFGAVADLTNPYGRQWLKGRLDFLVKTYGVDGFKFDGGDAEHYSARQMLTPGRAFQANATPNEHSELYARVGLDYPLNEYRACWKMGGQALAQRLRDKNHTWADLQKLIPGMLVSGLMGYAFTCPDMIGGGEWLSFRNLDKVDQELVVRGAQCHALMPMMQFSAAPWRILNRENAALCLAAARLHASMADEIVALAANSARTGEPMVRPLDYDYPGHGYATISDQFLLGPSILVAPVVQPGARQRSVHFPPGNWQGDDGTLVHGPCVVTVTAPLSRLPWYRRINATPR
jgi:alpha-glucosidase (family GH31 glycosyl hydrolase)